MAAAIADRLGHHRFVLLFCFITATSLQGAMAFAVTFPVQLALTIGVSTVWTGASIIGDAAVMAASSHVSSEEGYRFFFIAAVKKQGKHCFLSFPLSLQILSFIN